MTDRFLRMAFIFLIVYFALSFFFPKPEDNQQIATGDIFLEIADNSVAQGNLVRINVQNNTEKPLSLGTGYPPEELIFEYRSNGRWEEIQPENRKETGEEIVLAAGQKRQFEFSEYNQELFFETGEYRAVIRPAEDQEFSAEFEVYEPGFFRSLFRAIYKLVYNIFILLLMLVGHNLGVAIILTTLIIKMSLWTFTQRSLESQQKMQKIQPELQKIREKYKNDQQKMAAETMALWKKYNINPMGAFTPLFIQFPVLIALFYVIRDGLMPHNTYLLYPPLKDFDFSSINEVFLGLFNLSHYPLQDNWLLWLPFVVAGAQFIAMRLSFKRAEKKKAAQKEKKSEAKEPSIADQMQNMGSVMQYILPVMIFFFALRFPAGVGIYWLISTLMGIFQQYMVNKKVHA